MARAQVEPDSLRLGRGETARLLTALVISLLVHLAIYGGYHAGDKLGWWQKMHLPAWLHPAAKQFPLQAQIAHESEPTIFVDVSQADADAPTRTRYYSNKNSRAANPDVAPTDIPKINGSQTDYAKTEDVPKLVKQAAAPTPETPKEAPKEPPKEATKVENPPELAKLEPSMPPPTPRPEPPPPAPETPQAPGETDLPKPPSQNTAPPTPAAQPQPERPRTLRQALAQRDQLPGQQMQQAGGVARRAFTSTLDAKATPFGDYDRDIIEAVSQRWYDLLDSGRFAQDRTGKVILRFKLKPDGSVIEMQTLENTVGELLGYLCQEAIEEAAPFAKWPPDMARMIGTNYRDITFTFYYY